MAYVLDTAALLHGGIDLTSGKFVTTPSVIGEVRKGRLADRISDLKDFIDIREPTAGSIDRVREASKMSGNLQDLSGTDIDVVALALDVGGTVVTDDYSVQNVALSLSLKFMPCKEKGISGHITWVRRCSGCGAYVDSPLCPVCGHPVRRYYPKKRKI
ncbi:MAG: ribonuclease VapC [Candidatus Thermoplasmatota archaeon]|nr:ribonuclease VapC [Candidatus Thermoplasmatota archaeon]MCL5731044.1 ribonuclease VapC [Candidatus Thermoplasmatota archaeon]